MKGHREDMCYRNVSYQFVRKKKTVIQPTFNIHSVIAVFVTETTKQN